MINGKEISLSSVLNVIWDRGKKILQFTAGAVVIVFLFTYLLHKRYEASATMLMIKSKIGERTMGNPALSMKTYQVLFKDKNIMNQLIEKYNLKERPYRFKHWKDLDERIYVTSLPNTAAIKVYVVMEDAQMAADIANDLVDQVIKLNSRFLTDETETSVTKILGQLGSIQNEVNENVDTYRKLLIEDQLQVKRAELSTKLSIWLDLVQQQENMDHSIVEKEERVLQFEKIYSATDPNFQPLIKTKRSLLSDTILKDTVRDQFSQPVTQSDLQGISILEENINDMYWSLLTERKKLLVDLPAEIKKRESVIARIASVSQEINDLQAFINDKEIDEMIAKSKFDTSLEILSGIVKQEKWAGTTVTTERQDLVKVYDATPDDKKVFPKRTLISGLAGLLVFLLSTIYYLVNDLYGLLWISRKQKATANQ